MGTMQSLETMFTAAVFAEANEHDVARTLMGYSNASTLLQDYFCAATFAEENCPEVARSIAGLPEPDTPSLNDLFVAATFAEEGYADTAMEYVDETWEASADSATQADRFLEMVGLADLPVQYVVLTR